MTEENTRDRIVAFAKQCGAESRDAEDVALRRGWLDADGNPTADGEALIEALDEQEATRTVFRSVP